MKTSRLTKVAWVFLVMALIACMPAQDVRAAAKYPSKPVTIVVGGGTGGSQDSGQRGIQPYLQKALGVSVIVNNLPGAGGIVGANKVFDSPADGYTLLSGHTAHLLLYRMNSSQCRFGTDFLKSFTSLGLFLNEDVGALCVNKGSSFKTFADLLAKAKSSRATIGIGGGMGSSDHLTVLLLQKYFGGNWTIIPYPSGGEAAAALMGNHIDAGHFGVTGAADPDKFRILAQSGPKRVRQLPADIPTYTELGQKDLVVDWRLGLLVKKETDPEIMKTLKAALMTAASDPGFKEWAEKTKTPIGDFVNAEQAADYLHSVDQKSIQFLPLMQQSLKEMQQGKGK